MAAKEVAMAETGIRFFGRMSASATHEIKNTLAIINENAGLLEDLSMMAEKGHPLAPERVMDISQRMAKQVSRADLVLKKMNKFAHSVDLSREVADFEKTVMFVLDLASRILEMQGVVVEIVSPKSSMVVDINLFYLQNVIWRAIEIAADSITGKKQVMISFGTDSAPAIWFLMDSVKKGSMDDLFGSKEDRALIAYLDMTIEKNEEDTGFGLLWTKSS